MKKQNSPSILKYFTAILMLVLTSFALSFGSHTKEISIGEYSNTVETGGILFLILFGLSFVFGAARGRLAPKGSLRNDTLIINDTIYSGTVAPYFVLPAMFSFDSVVKKAVYVKDGIKKQHTIPTMDFSGPLQPRVATPTQSGGNLTVDGRRLIPNDIMAYQEMNPRNFEVHWDAENLSQTLLTRQLPATAENYIMLLLLGRSFEQFEVMIWQGSVQYASNVNVPQFDINGNPNPYYQIQFVDGYIKRMVSDSSIYLMANPVTLTASNIGAALESLYNSVATNNKALLTQANARKRMKFTVSIVTAQLYEQFLTTQTFKNNDTTEEGITRYKGFDVVALSGVPDNTILFTETMSTPEGNLWVGMNSIADENFMLARTLPKSEIFFFKMLMKMDVNYGRSEKVFLYTTLTANSFIQ